MLELRKLLVLSLEIADELLGTILFEAVRTDASLRLPLRPILPDQIEDPVLEFLRRSEGATLDFERRTTNNSPWACDRLLRLRCGQLHVKYVNEERPAVGLLLG